MVVNFVLTVIGCDFRASYCRSVCRPSIALYACFDSILESSSDPLFRNGQVLLRLTVGGVVDVEDVVLDC